MSSTIPPVPSAPSAPSLGNLNQAGVSANSASLTNQVNPLELPWNGPNSPVDSPFFNFINIDPTRWDTLFPYRLLVVDTSKPGNPVVNGTPNLTVTAGPGTSGTDVIIENINSSWFFVLPITPQQLNITDQYAISSTATLRGINELHGGVRFKNIVASGTMGVWSTRESIVSAAQTAPSALQTLFGGVLTAAQGVVNSVTSVINTLTNGNPNAKPVSKRPENSRKTLQTGYFQALALQQFLEQYAEAKRNPQYAGWRLVFDIPKQNQSLVVTPGPFTWQQNQNRPMEVLYNIQFKAWRRIDLKAKTKTGTANNQPLSPNTLQNILNSINQAQQVIGSLNQLVGAVTSAVELPLTALQQTSLLVKGLIGVGISIMDLPAQIVSDYKSGIQQAINNLSTSIVGTSTDPAVAAAVTAITSNTATNEGISPSATSGGQLGPNSAAAQSLSPVNAIFNNPAQNYNLLSQVPVSSLSLTDAQQNTINQIVQDASEITVDTLRTYRQTILQLALQLSNAFGGGSAFYNQVYGLPPPTVTSQPMTLDQYDILLTLYETIQAYDILTATTDLDSINVQTNMDYVAGLAATSGMTFNTTATKILSPVPYGLTIEGIAARYLGDPQRWLEIVTLNMLREPYIDETGFMNALLSNATGRQITIGDNTNLFVGQAVTLKGANQIAVTRTILDIETLSATSFLITLDGLPNLDNFTLASGAYLQAYLPGTVNSQQKIFIPSDLPATDPTSSNIVVPAGTSSDPFTGLSKVDWLLDGNGDVATNSYGDFRYSYGMTNIIQALQIKFGTIQGKFLLHPTFGLSLTPGMSTADANAQDIYNQINQMITQDPRFQGVTSLKINLVGPTLTISLAISLPNIQGVFPISFTLTP